MTTFMPRPGDEDLHESLLQHDEPGSSSYQPAPGASWHGGSSSGAGLSMIVWTPFSVDTFIRFIVQQWLNLLGATGICREGGYSTSIRE